MPDDPRTAADPQVLHTQLLAKIYEVERVIGEGPYTRALRAFTRLHKPEFFGGVIACLACSPGMPPPLLVEWSACETVEIIASALGVETP